jgi:protein-S-isoprenylcysteine O-methyltransferase Ste14
MTLKEEFEKQGNWLFRWRSYLPLLVFPLIIIALQDAGFLEYFYGDRAGDYWETFSIGVSCLGLLVRSATAGFVPKGTSGKNTKKQVAESLNTSGMYSVVRNPLYLGNFLIYFGITLFIQKWWLALIILFGFWFYYERIIFAEEEFLKKRFGSSFTQWAAKTPMFFPNLKNWEKPDLPFSLKTVIRREFSTMFAIVITYVFLEIAKNWLQHGRFEIGRSWVIFFMIGSVIYVICVVLKKKTNILNVSGR